MAKSFGNSSTPSLADEPGFVPFSETMAEATKRYAVVTGANKGIGLGICRELAANGVTVVLTARDEKRGLEALETLKQSGLSNVVFHQLDVGDPSSVDSLADFIKTQFGKLDILVNNAGILGMVVKEPAAYNSLFDSAASVSEGRNLSELVIQSLEMAEECVNINYYGPKRMIENLVPLLQLSELPRIVNVSSIAGKLQRIPNEWAKGVLSDDENLTEERVNEVLNQFLQDFKEGQVNAKSWPPFFAAYKVSKAALNAYTRLVAKKYPSFCINSVCPGYVKTDINYSNGYLAVEEGAENVVRLALLPYGGPSGLFFDRKEVSEL